MKAKYYFLFLLIVSANAFATKPEFCAEMSHADIIGEATDINTQEWLFCEYHFIDKSSNTAQVKYTNKQQSIIARKSIRYNENLLAPDVEQVDLRNNERRVTKFDTGKNQFYVEYLSPNSDADTVESTLISAKKGTVVDAGFDNAVRQYWQSLLDGDSVKLRFIAPPSQRTFGLRVGASSSTACDIASYTNTACFSVKSSSALLNWFIKPITLVYDKDSQRLLKYKGNVNILSASGEELKATIHYHYQ